MTTMIPELADLIGYSARDGFRRVKIHTAIGEEHGYCLRVAEFAVIGATIPSFALQVFDLGHEDIHGLLGMNFLGDFNFEVRSGERRIFVEKTTS